MYVYIYIFLQLNAKGFVAVIHFLTKQRMGIGLLRFQIHLFMT